MVLGVVFMTFAALLQYAYVEHDVVTGTMILEEAIEKTRGCGIAESDYDRIAEVYETKGNPRLWLGTYQLDLNVGVLKVSGMAAAGGWNQEIERSLFRPGRFLRQFDCLGNLKSEEERSDGGT